MSSERPGEPRAQTILVVDNDEATRRILDLSLRHLGFIVASAAAGDEAARRLAEQPDLVIAGADDAEGLAFCRRAKGPTSGGDGLPPAVVLIAGTDVESKRQGLEAGADDFVARPIYVQEVVARVRALLQRRERERLEISAQHSRRFVSAIEDVPLVDLLRAIDANQKSGVAVIGGGPSGAPRGEIYFRQGRVVDGEVGRLSGRDAIFRLFCWTSGRLEVEWKSIRRKDTIDVLPQDLLMEALRRVEEWRRMLAELPPLSTVFEVDYRLLAERLADIPDEVNRILRLFDGARTFMQVVDDCGMPDLEAVAAIGKLCRERIIHDVRLAADGGLAGADMQGWLADAAGPFRGGARAAARSAAAADPPSDGGRDAVDDEARARFADRLTAEGAGSAEEPTALVARDGQGGPASGSVPVTVNGGITPTPVPVGGGATLARPVEPAPALQGRAPATAPFTPLARRTSATTISIDNGAGGPSTLPGIATARGDAGRASSEIVALPAPESVPSASGPETVRGLPASPAAPGGATTSGDRRSAAGEIVVRRTPVNRPAVSSSGDLVVALPDTDGRGFATDVTGRRLATPPSLGAIGVSPRGTHLTPPGSARALDEPPPYTVERLSPSERTTKLPSSEPAERRALAASGADDDIVLPSRRRGIALAAVAAVLVAGTIGWVALRPSRVRRPPQPNTSAELAPATPPATTESLAVPVPVPPAPSKPAGATPLGAAAPSADGRAPASTRRTAAGADAALPSGPGTAAREDLDERSADPKMARARAAEAGTLLTACNRAFSERRMKDAEAACTAAKDANPDSAEANGLLAHSLFNRNRRREALGAAERAVRLNPKWADAYVIIGGVHQDGGDLEQARRAYQRYLDLEPKGQYAADLRAIIGKLPAKL